MKIKHPAASSGVLTALYNLLVFNQLSPQGGGELNPQRLKKPLTDKELEDLENSRDLGIELLESVRQMKAGKGRIVMSPLISTRKKSGLSQVEFAKLFGVSVRTLQDWEQRRRNPSGAAKALIAILERHPDVLKEIAT
jgi:putative transcriptional regulator